MHPSATAPEVCAPKITDSRTALAARYEPSTRALALVFPATPRGSPGSAQSVPRGRKKAARTADKQCMHVIALWTFSPDFTTLQKADEVRVPVDTGDVDIDAASGEGRRPPACSPGCAPSPPVVLLPAQSDGIGSKDQKV